MRIEFVELYEIEDEENIHHYILECVCLNDDCIFEGYQMYAREMDDIIRAFYSSSYTWNYGRYSKSIHRNDTKLLCRYESTRKFVDCVQIDYPELFI